jgi:hypothetical protein
MGSLPYLKDWAQPGNSYNSAYLEEQASRFAVRSQRGPQRRNEVLSLPLQALRALALILIVAACLSLCVVVYRVAKHHQDDIVNYLPNLRSGKFTFPKGLSNAVSGALRVNTDSDSGASSSKVRYYL